MISDEIKYHLLSLLEKDPHLSQRDMAKAMGISLGKVNYCLKALVEKGVIKAKNFYHHDNKFSYSYFLTPKGVREKTTVTYRFLMQKMQEYEVLKHEIENIRADMTILNAAKQHNDSVKN